MIYIGLPVVSDGQEADMYTGYDNVAGMQGIM